MKTENNDSIKKYFTVLSDGKFHQQVPDGTPGSVVREYEDSNNVVQKKTEMVYDSVTGIITDISFEDGNFGKNLKIELDNEGTVSVSTASSFGEDLMKKLPAIDLSQEVKLVPYSFEDDHNKSRKGITVYQGENKIENYYYDGATKSTINGLPEPDEDTSSFDSDDWKMYFMKVRKFLVGEIEKLIESNFKK